MNIILAIRGIAVSKQPFEDYSQMYGGVRGLEDQVRSVCVCVWVGMGGRQHPLLENHVTFSPAPAGLAALPVIPPPSPPMDVIQFAHK